ncbi:MAG TPA: nucleotide exchange factor GrpE [Methanotrichaceae archaeon]|nr:nucleotide exchange factor GrpE [Methanotrichaceae archaeon]
MKAKHSEKTSEPSEKKGKAASPKTGTKAEAGVGTPEEPVEEAVDMGLEELDSEELRLRLKEACCLSEERTDQLLRCRAELDNTIKRAAREKEALSRYASEKLISKLLPVLDSLDQAAKHVEGMDNIRLQLLDVLKTDGLEPIEAKGEKFDPYKHEALMMVESDEHDEGTVTEEVQRGYTLNSRVIRFSKVLVSKKR